MRIKFLFYILFSYSSLYGQLDITDTITNNIIDWEREFVNLNNLHESQGNSDLSTIIAIDINQNRDNLSSHREVYKWLTYTYDVKKIKLKVYVINESSSKNNFSICCDENQKNIECSQSTLFLITKNSSLKDYLSKNLTLLSMKEIPISNNDSFIVYQFSSIKDPEDFVWKTKQLFYNLEHIPQAEKKEISKTNFFQISYQSSLINSKNTQFDRASNNQIDLIMKKKICCNKNSIQILVGGGISLAQNRFSSSNNSQYVQKGSYPLDSIYASLSGVRENYSYQSINLVGFLAVKIKKFEFSLSPFYALQSNLSSTVTGGSITTYGSKNQITDYLYDIPELGLKTQTEEILKVQNYFKTSSYGFNAGVSYNINLGTLIVAPNLNLKFISIHNKNQILNSYSIPEDKYNGLFATLKNKYFFIPTLGLSISF
jgi:hypothetical protein